jgi:hypothetical protein
MEPAIRRTIALFLALSALAAVAPTGARAATQVGQTFAPPDGCSPDVTNLQTTSTGMAYAAPTAGVITSWSYQADNIGTPNTIKFKVARATGLNQYADVGQSPLVTMVPGMLNTFLIRISVRAGDVIGFYKAAGTAGCSRSVTGNFVHFRAGDSGAAPSTFTPFATPAQIDLSATLEPDCDSDGFGDETQEPAPPPCGPTGQRAAALKKCKKKRSKKALKRCRRKANLLPV